MVDETQGALGLANLGNTCFMNAVLQALRNNKEWTHFCIKGKVDAHLVQESSAAKTMMEAYIELLKSLWGGKGPGYVNPRGFYTSLSSAVKGTIYEDFARRMPHDAHEFLVWLLDQMYMATQGKVEMKLKDEERIEPMIRQALKGWIGSFEKQYSPLADLIFGMFRIQYTCSACGTIHNRWETFNTLKYTPKLNDKGEPLPLLECLQAEFAEETIDEYACDECVKKSPKARSPAKKSVKIWRLPKFLILTAKRFTPTGQKLHYPLAPVDEPKFFDIFAPESHEPSKHKTYELFATVEHHGSHFGGHYTSQAKHLLTGQWALYDDESIHKIEKPEITRSTYMMFLTQKD